MKSRGAMPLISFIIPVFNVRKFLPECIESIVAQPFHDLEIILVNDNSDDGCGDICDRFAVNDTRITALHLPANVGPGLARNEGLKCATGDYVAFVDGDDSIVPGELAKLWDAIVVADFPDMMHVGYAESFGWQSFESNVTCRTPSDTSFTVDTFLEPFLEHERFGFFAWEFIYKRSMLLDRGVMFGSARIGEDFDFTIRCLFMSRTVGEFGRVFYNWRTRLSGSLTSAHVRCWDQMLKSAVAILGFACSGLLSNIQRQFALSVVSSDIAEFQMIAAAVSVSDVECHLDLFDCFENHLNNLDPFVTEGGLLWHIREFGALKGSGKYCSSKSEEIHQLLFDIKARDVFGFPASRRTSRQLAVLNAIGYNIKGLLDNEPKKHGLILDGLTIFKPDIIPLCYLDDSNIFIIISTATAKTGRVLADQLISYGLEEGSHFCCSGI